MKAEESIDFNLRAAWLNVSRVYNEIATLNELTMSMAFILLNINGQKGSNPTKLGPKMGMQANSLSRSLKSLEEKGLIYRKKSKEDKRQVRIFLTALGEEKRAIALDVVNSFNVQVKDKLNAQQLQHFFQVIEAVHDTVTDMRNAFSEEHLMD